MIPIRLGIKKSPEDFLVVELDPGGCRVDAPLYCHPAPPPKTVADELKKEEEVSAQKETIPIVVASCVSVEQLLPGELYEQLVSFAQQSEEPQVSERSDELVLGDVPFLDKAERGTLRVAIRHEFPMLNTNFRAADGTLSVIFDRDVALLVRCLGRDLAERLVRLSLPGPGHIHDMTRLGGSYQEGLSAQDRQLFHSAIQRVCPFLRCFVQHGQVSFSRSTPKRGRDADTSAAVASPREYTHCIAKKRGVDSLSLVAAVASHFNLTEGQVGLCGLKDRCAVTFQRMSIRGNLVSSRSWPIDIPSFATDGSTIELLGPAAIRPEPLAAGSLSGNAFSIVLRPETEKDVAELSNTDDCFFQLFNKIERRATKIVQDGFPNYFGLQRFSRVSSLGRHTGIHLLAGRWAVALESLFDEPPESSVQSSSTTGDGRRKTPREAWVLLLETGDADAALAGLSSVAFRDAVAALAALKRVLAEDRMLLRPIDATSLTWAKQCRAAFDYIPFCLKQLWLHAAQSLMFNVMLSTALLAQQTASVPRQLPLLGANTIGPSSAQLPLLVHDVLRQLDLSSDALSSRSVVGVPLRGGWRDSFVHPRNLAVERAAQGLAVTVCFELPPSSYATVFLQEVLGYMPRDL